MAKQHKTAEEFSYSLEVCEPSTAFVSARENQKSGISNLHEKHQTQKTKGKKNAYSRSSHHYIDDGWLK